MLQWAVTFLVLAIIAGLLGFGGIAAISVEMAKILFVIFLVLFLAAVLFGLARGRAPKL